MLRYFSFILCCTLLLACDDGDILNFQLDFEDTLSLCPTTSTSSSYFLYKTKNDPSQSLTLLFPVSGNEDIFPAPSVTEVSSPTALNVAASKTLTIGGSSSNTRFNYRSYNRNVGNNELCGIIPPSDLVITENYEAPSGQINVTTTFVDDDNDGIPSVNEGQDPNGDGDFSDAQDSDNDGIPDYLDEDDDNDNVKTINEDNNADGDNNPFTDARDTDNDDKPDYLDDDDDGDGILTRLEDENGNKSLTDDFNEPTDGSQVPPRFLDANAAEPFDDAGVIGNTYKRIYTSVFVVLNADLQIINSEEINFGTYTSQAISISQN